MKLRTPAGTIKEEASVDRRHDGLAAAPLEAADPGLAGAVPGGDGSEGQALVAVGEDPLSEVE
jgi:hypothetical protein